MRPRHLALAALLALGAAPPPRTTAEVLAATAPADWRPIAVDRLLAMELAGGRRVLIELAPGFAPRHVANIVRLARARWWDGLAVVRAQDNYVAQWGDPDGAKPKPPGVAALAPEWERPAAGLAFAPIPGPDGYAPEAGFADSWPVARRGGTAWLVHCYAMVGAGREEKPDTGDGSELYAVIGHATRNLDRNVTLVGRVVEGMEHLSSLPRGAGPLGFYERPGERAAIVAARLAADLPEAERPRLEMLRSGTAAFRAWVDSRRNRREPFFVNPAGHADLCALRLPVRARAGGMAR